MKPLNIIATIVGVCIIGIVGVVVFNQRANNSVNTNTSMNTTTETATPTENGEYLGFDIVTFRHDPTAYDETEEYIEIQWLGPNTVDLKGYYIDSTSAGRDVQRYTFPSVTLKANETIKVYSRAGAGKYNFGAAGEIWEDDSSEVRLYSPEEYLEAYYGQ